MPLIDLSIATAWLTGTSKADALIELVAAYEYAQDTNRDLWEFPVEFDTLRSAGLSRNDLHWLVCKGYVQHAPETANDQIDDPSVLSHDKLRFTEKSRLILTAAGVSFARQLCANLTSAAQQDGSGTERHLINSAGASLEPSWDSERRVLSIDGQVVKQFKQRSPNQEKILSAFHEENWPARIDDPLPQQPQKDPKRRLNDTIKSLNRNQCNELIVFQGDGSGEGIIWQMPSARPLVASL